MVVSGREHCDGHDFDVVKMHHLSLQIAIEPSIGIFLESLNDTIHSPMLPRLYGLALFTRNFGVVVADVLGKVVA